MGSIRLMNTATWERREAKNVTATDDHSRLLCVIAKVVERATGRAVRLGEWCWIALDGLPELCAS